MRSASGRIGAAEDAGDVSNTFYVDGKYPIAIGARSSLIPSFQHWAFADAANAERSTPTPNPKSWATAPYRKAD